jgi:hypothetical protein
MSIPNRSVIIVRRIVIQNAWQIPRFSCYVVQKYRSRAEFRCPRSGSAGGKVEFDAALFAEAVHYRLEQAWCLAWLRNGVGENGADFGFHGSAVTGGPDAEPFLHPVIKVANAERGQRDRLLAVLAMIAMIAD